MGDIVKHTTDNSDTTTCTIYDIMISTATALIQKFQKLKLFEKVIIVKLIAEQKPRSSAGHR